MPIDPIAPTLRVVRCNARYCDPAIDTVETPLDAYRATRDPDVLKLREGQKPAWFVLRRLRASFVMEALDSFEGAARISVAARAGIAAVELPDGRRLEPASSDRGAYDTPIADAAWLDEIAKRFGIDTVREMGRAVIELSALGEGARGPLFSSAG